MIQGIVIDPAVADDDLYFLPCRTCVLPVDRMPAVLHFPTHSKHCPDANGQLPAVLNSPSCRTHMSPVDGLPCSSPDFVQLPADTVVDSHASHQALSDWDKSQVTNMCDDKLVDDNVFDENAGLPRADLVSSSSCVGARDGRS